MWIKTIAGLGLYELLLNGLFQAGVIPDNLLTILEQYPPLVVVLIVVYYLQKVQREDIQRRQEQYTQDTQDTREWLERMLEIQRQSLQEIYGGRDAFITALLNEMEVRQTRTDDKLEKLASQLAINTSTVSEIAKVDAIISELIARLEKK